MAQNRYYYTNEYIDGNTVRKTNERTQPVTRRRARSKKKATGLTMEPAYVAFLGAASLICLCMCISYLYIQASISTTNKNISKLRATISSTQAENDALSYSINTSVNVNNIYKKATTKLGMAQATDKQISVYDASEDGYTLQYGDIPTK